MKKKVDIRIKTLIENGLKTRQRTFFVIIGDRGRDQVVNFHFLLSKMYTKGRPTVLWCYKKELGFSTHRQKRMKEVKKLMKKGLYDPNQDEPFDLFVSSTEIRYCYYKETQNILGNTYNMLVLQDFESLTPNILCRTIETVEGGGIVIMLFKTMTSLKQLYTMTMDVHQRFRTEAHKEVRPLFNERMILSLGNCRNCLVMDDELNILPISSLINEITPITESGVLDIKISKELSDLKASLKENSILGSLVEIARTLDQAKAIMMMFSALVEKNIRHTVSLTAGRGRGKSAAVGIIVAGAVAVGFSGIYVTAPSPENLKTFFNFVIEGLKSLGYSEHQHFELIQSTNEEYNKAIIRVNVFKNHRQIIQYIEPQDHSRISNADLLIIDEASAIPLIHVKQLLGPYLVFLSSTINGYEGTGRSLSLKLIQKLKEQSRLTEAGQKSGSGVRVLKEITLNDPIRYALDDPIEKWLYDLLCLNATNPEPLKKGLPHPNDCELYLVNRETLFSYNKASEKFLYHLWSLFVSSHYKNSPNDLQLLSDAPAHAVFVLIGPLQKSEGPQAKNEIPDILCAIQVCLEGQIGKAAVKDNTARGMKPSGDLIPWTMREQFQDNDFPTLSGVRIVRIATHSLAQKMGYGSKALELMENFFDGKMISLSEDVEISSFEDFDYNPDNNVTTTEENKNSVIEQNKSMEVSIVIEKVAPKKKVKPLLKKLSEVKPPNLDWLGVSFGLNPELFRFWKKNGYSPCYLRQTMNEVTAEHTCVMLKALKQENEKNWVMTFAKDFLKRFTFLLGYELRSFEVPLVLSILDPNLTSKEQEEEADAFGAGGISKAELETHLSLYDLKRLEAYSSNLVDYRLITDLLPTTAQLFFLNKLSKSLKVSYAQAAILIGIGLQYKSIEIVAEELKLPVQQALALFNKMMRKFTKHFRDIFEKEIAKTIVERDVNEVELNPIKKKSSGDDLEGSGKVVIKKIAAMSESKPKSQLVRKGKNLDDIEHHRIDNDANEEVKGEEVTNQGSLDKVILPRKEDDGFEDHSRKKSHRSGGNKNNFGKKNNGFNKNKKMKV